MFSRTRPRNSGGYAFLKFKQFLTITVAPKAALGEFQMHDNRMLIHCKDGRRHCECQKARNCDTLSNVHEA